jgi:hypothetical protein
VDGNTVPIPVLMRMPRGQPAPAFDEMKESSQMVQWWKSVLCSLVSETGLADWKAAVEQGHLLNINADGVWDGNSYGQACIVAGGKSDIRGLGRLPAGYKSKLSL